LEQNFALLSTNVQFYSAPSSKERIFMCYHVSIKNL